VSFEKEISFLTILLSQKCLNFSYTFSLKSSVSMDNLVFAKFFQNGKVVFEEFLINFNSLSA
jgi:hypothetical protein